MVKKMGNINLIWNPEEWEIIEEKQNNLLEDDIIYKMIIGSSNNEEDYDIIDYISKTNYEKIINKTYELAVFPYATIQTILLNENKEIIPLVNGQKPYYDILSNSQIEYLKRIATNFDCVKIKKRHP